MSAATAPAAAGGRPSSAPSRRAIAGSRPRGSAYRRAIAGTGAVIAVIGVAALTGCSANTPASPANGTGTAPNALATPLASAPPGTPPPPATPAPPQSSPTPAAVPVLGRPAGIFAQGQGFGQVKPVKIFNGGDPTGLVTGVVWSSWGGPRATASGTSDYVGNGQSVASGTQKPVTVVAFKLGTCHGTLMYKAVEWYFPGEGGAFNPHQYENICTGSYVPTP
jgi:hypothetical protein